MPDLGRSLDDDGTFFQVIEGKAKVAQELGNVQAHADTVSVRFDLVKAVPAFDGIAYLGKARFM